MTDTTHRPRSAASGAARVASPGTVVAVSAVATVVGGLATLAAPPGAGRDPVLWSEPLAAAGLVLGGAALAVLRDPGARAGQLRAGAVLAWGVALVGLAVLVGFAAGAGEAASGRPSFHAGLVLVLLGGALTALDARPGRGPQPAQFLALVALLVAAVALLGYAGGAAALYSMGDAGLSRAGAAVTAVLAAGVLWARPHAGFVSLLRAGGGAGLVARTLALAPLVIPLGMGLLVLLGQRAGLLGPTASAWLFQMAYFGGFTFIIWWVASVVRRAEFEAARHQEHFRAVAETAAQAVVSADRSGRVTYLNPAGERMFGWAAADLVGRPLSTLFPDRLRADHQKDLERLLATEPGQTAGRAAEAAGARRDGTEFPVEVSLASWRAGTEVRVTAILTDITDRKRAEEQLRAANQELAGANKELEAFSYSVSHDLRAPLRAIHGFARILAEEYAGGLPEDAREYLADVLANARQMGQLVDDLLAFARLGKQPLKSQVVRTGALVRQCVAEIEADHRGRAVEVVIGDLPDCTGDAGLLKQVWLNLLSNAWKYSRAKEAARVEVGTGPAPDGADAAMFFVRDNGAGFDMQYADKLFGVFQRLHRAEEFEGTGVGLAIVQRVVHRHGGRVWADARPGAGATFYFTLPRSRRGQ